MEGEWVLNCLQHELLIDRKCIPFEKVEKEILTLLAKGGNRSHADNVRLAVIVHAMEEHLHAMKDLENQARQSSSYLSRMLGWFYSFAGGSGDTSGSVGSSESSDPKGSGASVQRHQRRRNYRRTKSRREKSTQYKRRRRRH